MTLMTLTLLIDVTRARTVDMEIAAISVIGPGQKQIFMPTMSTPPVGMARASPPASL